MAPMPLTGTIGAAMTGNSNAADQGAQAVSAGLTSNRRTQPDQVTSFFLPTVERPKPKVEERTTTASKQPQRGRKSIAIKEAVVEQEIKGDESAAEDGKEEVVNDGTLSVEASMILLQSLRQSRLIHLTALLPYLSTRHRTSTKYHPHPEGMPYPGGLDTVATPSPTLITLGRADVRVGPFVFPRTRFGEARVDEETSRLAAKGAGGPATTTTPIVAGTAGPSSSSTATTPAPTSPKTPAPAPKASPAPAVVTSPPTLQASTSAALAVPAAPAPASTPSAPAAASTSPTPGAPVATAIPASSTTPASAAAAPGGLAPQPPINARVVKAVSAAASNDPALQKMLHAAANNKATPEQLRALAAFIARVGEALEKIEAGEEAAQPSISAAGAGVATTNGEGKQASTGVANTKLPAKQPKKKKVKASASASGGADTAGADATPTRLVPPPPSHAAPPSYPPIITIEYREHPSARFILPVWRGASVERRRETDGSRSVKVTMLLPAIGSSAALRAAAAAADAAQVGTEEPTGKGVKAKAKAKAKKAAAAAAKGKKAAGSADEPSATSTPAFSPANPPTKDDLQAPAPAGAETHAMTWSITGTSDMPLSDGIWNVFGRVDGVKTFVNGVLQLEEEEIKPQPSDDAAGTTATKNDSKPTQAALSEQALTTLIAKIRSLPSDDTKHLPKLRVMPDEVPRDLAEHLTDRFAPRMQTLTSRPIVRIKRGAAGEEDDHVEIVHAKVAKRARFQSVEDGVADASWSSTIMPGLGDDSTEAGTPKPKRKRHVTKINPDGSLKLCQACGTNNTPMWRRGPAGKSTLCNACGAKWKVGRLVVPDQPPSAPLVQESPRRHAPAPKAGEGDSVPEAAVATTSVVVEPSTDAGPTAVEAVPQTLDQPQTETIDAAS